MVGNLRRVTHGIRLLSHQPPPERICSFWRKSGALSWLGATLLISLMYEAGLGKVMSGTEAAPAALADGTPVNVAAQEAAAFAFKEHNGKLYTRLLLATSDCPEGYSSAASQVVQSVAQIGTEEFGDGRGAFLALETKYCVYVDHRMQELHDQFGSLEATAADQFDPTRVI